MEINDHILFFGKIMNRICMENRHKSNKTGVLRNKKELAFDSHVTKFHYLNE